MTTPKIYISAPHINEDLTQAIAMDIAERTGAEYTNHINTDLAAMVVEIGGILDRGDITESYEIMVEDKTQTKPFKTILEFWFKIKECDKGDFKTRLSSLYLTNYVRFELTNRIRYCEVTRNFFVLIVSEILNELQNVMKKGGD